MRHAPWVGGRARASRVSIARLLLLPLTVGCVGDAAGPHRGRGTPSIDAISVAANPYNALAVDVTFRARNTDSVRVLYRPASALPSRETALAAATPFFPVTGDSGRVVVLGLRPETAIDFVVEGRGDGVGMSATSLFRTGSLPAALASLRLSVTGVRSAAVTLTDFSSPGSAFLVAFDSTGNVCWYREFPAGDGEAALDAEQQPNGDFTIFVGASTGWQPTAGRFFEVTPRGDVVRTYSASGTSYTDPHEILLDFSGESLRRVHLFSYDLRRMDLTSLGGRANQLVAGHSIVRQSPGGAVEFSWSAWDEFTIADWIFVPPTLALMTSIDFDHPNSLDIDADGHYVASFANLGLVAKIDASTGRMLWRLGGRRSDFTILGDPLGGFGTQHNVRVLPSGNILMFDNGVAHNPRESRAVEYRLDPHDGTATMVWQYRHDPPLFAPFAGSAQRLANGNTFVAFGAQPTMVEVAPDASVIWEGQMTTSGRPVPFIYKAMRLASLYRFERP